MNKLLSILILIASVTCLPVLATADEDTAKRDLVLEYLQYVGVVDSISLQVETLFSEYVEYYPHLPNEFWEDSRVTAIFTEYKVSLLRGYVEAMEERVSDEDLAFLVKFYATEDGKRVVALGKVLDPLMIAAATEAGTRFSLNFSDHLEDYAN